jgi:DHA2 family multidrug resistance protein
VVVGLSGAASSGGSWLSQPDHRASLLPDGNFCIGLTMSFISGVVLFGGTFLIPQYLGLVRGYTAGQIGTVMIVAGLGMLVTAPLAGRLAQVLDARIQMLIGYGVCGLGFWLGRDITDQWGFWEFAWLQALRSFGLMLAMLSTQNVTMATLPGPLIKSASGLLNLARNTGGAVGLALISTTLGTGVREHLYELSAAMDVANARSQSLLAGLTERMTALGVADPEGAARKAVWGMLNREALTLTFGEAFAMVAVACFVAAIAAQFSRPRFPAQFGQPVAAKTEPAH